MQRVRWQSRFSFNSIQDQQETKSTGKQNLTSSFNSIQDQLIPFMDFALIFMSVLSILSKINRTTLNFPKTSGLSVFQFYPRSTRGVSQVGSIYTIHFQFYPRSTTMYRQIFGGEEKTFNSIQDQPAVCESGIQVWPLGTFNSIQDQR